MATKSMFTCVVTLKLWKFGLYFAGPFTILGSSVGLQSTLYSLKPLDFV